MSKEKGVGQLFELETSLPVDEIKVDGVAFWPVIRVYIGSALSFGRDTRVTASSSINLRNLKSMFYGWVNIFRRWDYLAFSSSDQRKFTNGKWWDKMDFLTDNLANGVILELPNSSHKKRRDIPYTNVASKIPLYAVSLIIERFIHPNIEGEELLDRILAETDLRLNKKAIARKFRAQCALARMILKIKSLKAFFLTTAYTNFGFIYEFKRAGIPVVEFQHGTINEGHFAYNIADRIDENLYPDYLLSYGDLERKALINSKYVGQDAIIPIGSFQIDHILEEKIIHDDYLKATEGFKKVVCISAQDRLEDHFIPFLKEVSKSNPSIGFWLLPRFRKPEYYDRFSLPENVFYLEGYNTYQAILLSDFHSTINSTTAIEALVLGTRNILMDVNGLSVSFFGKILTDKRLTAYAGTPESFTNQLGHFGDMSKEEVRAEQPNLIKTGFKRNLSEALKKIQYV